MLTDIPQKTFNIKSQPLLSNALNLPANLSVNDALERVLKLLSVGSKRFLMTKVDRCVTGLIAQQQCVGTWKYDVHSALLWQGARFSFVVGVGEFPRAGGKLPKCQFVLTDDQVRINILRK